MGPRCTMFYNLIIFDGLQRSSNPARSAWHRSAGMKIHNLPFKAALAFPNFGHPFRFDLDTAFRRQLPDGKKADR